MVDLLYACKYGYLCAWWLALFCQQLSALGGNMHMAIVKFTRYTMHNAHMYINQFSTQQFDASHNELQISYIFFHGLKKEKKNKAINVIVDSDLIGVYLLSFMYICRFYW